MSETLHNPEDTQATILLYLADELPPADRARLEQLLATDAQVNAKLQAMRRLQDDCAQLLAGGATPGCGESSVRSIVALIKQHQARRMLSLSTDTHPAMTWRLPRWSYPLIAAAASLFILLGLWGVGAFDHSADRRSEPNDQALASQEVLLSDLERSFAGPANDWLDEADRHVQALREEDDWLPMM